MLTSLDKNKKKTFKKRLAKEIISVLLYLSESGGTMRVTARGGNVQCMRSFNGPSSGQRSGPSPPCGRPYSDYGDQSNRVTFFFFPSFTRKEK